MLDKSLFMKAVRLDLPSEKGAALRTAVEALAEEAGVPAAEALEAVLAREKVMPTAIGLGVAIPHAKMKGLKKFAFCIGRAKQPIDYDAPDKQPVQILAVLLSPDDKVKEHVKLIAEITRRLKFNHVRHGLVAAKTAKEAVDVFQQAG